MNCQLYSEHNTGEISDSYIYECPNKAKFITPPDILNKKKYLVCGVHRRSIDTMRKRLGFKIFCQPIKKGD